MSTLGNLELYGLVIKDTSDTVEHRGDSHALTAAQASHMIYTAEDNLVAGAPAGYQNLSSIVYNIEVSDNDASRGLSTVLSKLYESRISNVSHLSSAAHLFSDGVSTDISTLSSVIFQLHNFDWLDDSEVSTNLSSYLSADNSEISSFSRVLSSHMSQVSTEDSAYLDTAQSYVSRIESNISEWSTTQSTHNSETSFRSNNLSTELSEVSTVTTHGVSTLSSTLKVHINDANTNSDNMSEALVDNSNAMSLEVSTVSSAIQAQEDTYLVSYSQNLSEDISTYSANVSNSLSTNTQNRINTSDALSTELSKVSNEQREYSLDYSTYSTNLSTDIANESVAFSNDMSTATLQRGNQTGDVTNTMLSKVDETNPVMMGALVMNKDFSNTVDGNFSQIGNFVQIGDNWRLIARTVYESGNSGQGDSSLVFQYKNNGNWVDTIPFMAQNVNLPANGAVNEFMKLVSADTGVTLAQNDELSLVDPVTGSVHTTHVCRVIVSDVDGSKIQIASNYVNGISARPGTYQVKRGGNVQGNVVLDVWQVA